MADSSYPYTGAMNTCKRTANPANLLVPKGKVTGWAREARSVLSLLTRMATTPFSIGVNAACDSYRYYKSGIITLAQCPGDGTMDHSNSVVGYVAGNDTCTINNNWACEEVPEGGSYYWLVQNSWGTGWGEGGYARFEMADGFGVACMNCDATYPTLASYDPPSATVTPTASTKRPKGPGKKK